MTVEGIGQVDAAFRAYEAEVQRELRDLISETATTVAARAAELAPERTGRLRKGIVADLSRVLSGMSALVVSGAFYGRMVEYGTRAAAARPHVIPALEEGSQAFYEAVRRILNRA